MNLRISTGDHVADVTLIDGPKYLVVINRTLGIIYRIRKPRVGLMRFSR